MTTQDIANKLVELCRTQQYDQAYKDLFAKDAVANEPAYTQQPEVKGLDNLLAKGAQFAADVKEFHGSYVTEPIVAGNHFTVGMGVDYTRQNGERMKMDEVCVYQVKDGKIVKEQFFY